MNALESGTNQYCYLIKYRMNRIWLLSIIKWHICRNEKSICIIYYYFDISLPTDFLQNQKWKPKATIESANFEINVYKRGVVVIIHAFISKLALSIVAFDFHFWFCKKSGRQTNIKIVINQFVLLISNVKYFRYNVFKLLLYFGNEKKH